MLAGDACVHREHLIGRQTRDLIAIMTSTEPIADSARVSRRGLLYVATAAVGAAGLAAAAWPLIDQMNPDARTRAAGDRLSVDIGGLKPAEQMVVRWQKLPVIVVHRTPEMLATMQEKSFLATLFDADSAKRQQPGYARNWHRSLDPAYAVLVAVCTSCRCVPEYLAASSALNVAGGYICPCCASRYDPAGRAYAGIARYNLPVPPYALAGPSKIVLGKNATDEVYSLDSVEQI
jgi:ubiquinol-cytochrome c reductase iron-sulfur subunit